MVERASAAVLTAPRMFEFREFDIPEIGSDEAVLRVEAAGLCGTDYEQYAGHLTGTPWDIWDIIPGHEIFGWIDRIGADAAAHWNVKERDRVVVEAIIPCSCASSCNGARTGIAAIVVQFGLAIIPFGVLVTALAFTSGTTRGTSGSIRHADELSMTKAP